MVSREFPPSWYLMKICVIQAADTFILYTGGKAAASAAAAATAAVATSGKGTKNGGTN